MPGVTPNFAIPYPCAGETIDAGVFQDFADGVEAALAAVDVLSAAALQRPRAAIRHTVPAEQAVAPGAMTAIVYSTTDFASGITAGAGGFTALTNGLYLVSLNIIASGSPTTITSWAGEIIVSGTVKYRRKLSENPAHLTPGSFNATGVVFMLAAQAATFTYGWTGTAPNVSIYSRATINQISTV